MKIILFMICILFLSSGEANQYTEEDKVRLANQAAQSPQNQFTVDSKAILTLLKNENFVELKALLVDAENRFSADAGYEWGYLKAYEDFGSFQGESYSELLQHLNKWVEQDNSYVSIAARGFCIYGEAQRYRGRNYIGSVQQENLVKARELWDLSSRDLLNALKVNPLLLPAYSQLIKNYRHVSRIDDAKNVFSDAIKNVPLTYYVRQNAILFEQPKWGGDYQNAQKIIDEAQKYGDKNPRLWNLRGNIYANKGYACETSSCAIDFYKQALSYGDKLQWITNLAYSYYKAGDYQMSIETIKRISVYTENKDKLEKLIASLVQLGKTSGAPPQLISASAQIPQPRFKWSDFNEGW